MLVADMSVLIDLERGALLETCFRLPFLFAVPDLLYRRELRLSQAQHPCKNRGVPTFRDRTLLL